MTTPDGPGADVAQLIQSLKENAQRYGLTWNIAVATVIDISNPASIVLQFDGDDSVTPGGIAMIPTSAGARVYVMQVPPAGSYIVGYAAPAALATVHAHFVGGGPTQNSTSSAFTNILNASSTNFGVVINKKFNGTALRIDAAGTYYSTSSQSGPLFSIQVTGVTGPDSGNAALSLPSHWVGFLAIANATQNQHTPWSGTITLPGLSAGEATVQLYWQRNNGTGGLRMDANDAAWLTVSEVWPS